MRRNLLVGFLFLFFASVVCLMIWAGVALPGYFVGIHQQSVTASLAEWGSEYRNIESQHDAIRTAEMLEYVQHHYIPGEGYRSTPEIEEELQSQRQDTIDTFVTALRAYTGEDFGTDSASWIAHLKSSGPENGHP